VAPASAAIIQVEDGSKYRFDEVLKGHFGRNSPYLLTYCKIFFKLTHDSPVAPPIITIKGAGPNFYDDAGKFDPCCGRNLEIWSRP